MKFCPDCGEALASRMVGHRSTTYLYCDVCQQPRYDHPSVMLTCFISCDNKLLWIQRKLEPRSGFWAIPGGFMEAGESLAEGAARELFEETGIQLNPADLDFYMTGTITFINQVYVAFRASVEEVSCEAGAEALAVAFFSREQCPWDEVAYPEVNDAIRRAYDDLEQGKFGIYQAQMTQEMYRLDAVVTRP